MQEFQALLELLAMLITDPRSVVLFVLLAVASVSDWRSYRIPNWLTFGGAAFALLYHTAAARTPGPSPSSSTASRDINDTRRYSPAAIST